ncbi:RCC1 domain-containing protein [Rhodococcus triatomae]
MRDESSLEREDFGRAETASEKAEMTSTRINRNRRRALPQLLFAMTAALGLTASMVGQSNAAPVGVANPPGGTAYAWGMRDYGQTAVPSTLANETFTAVATGSSHSMALTDDGAVHVWPTYNLPGGDPSAPPQELRGKTVKAIAAGNVVDDYFLALTDDGVIHAWGSNLQGATTIPEALTGKKVTAITAYGMRWAALTEDGSVHVWHPYSYMRATPNELKGKKVTAIAANTWEWTVLTDEGGVYSWTGDGTPSSRTPDMAGKAVTAIAAADRYNLALTDDGVVHGWGLNNFGQTDVPQELTGKTVTAIAAGAEHAMALASDGTLHAWGSNSHGQTDTPQELTGKTVTAIAAGWRYSMAIAKNTTVGPGNPTDPTDPVDPTDPTDPGNPTEPSQPGAGAGSLDWAFAS